MRRTPTTIAATIATATAIAATLLGTTAPSYADERRPAGKPGGSASGAPGSLTGYAFDTCAAPAQEVMDTWWEQSPYSGVGIYISGSNRLCDQPELTPGWVKEQLRRGWHLLPLVVGPQASCSGYADKMSPDLATANQQGGAQAQSAVAAAKGLGIGKGSTLYYDLEDYDIAPDDCRRAALSFLSGWTEGLHAAGYDSGVYSNIAAAITSLDFADRVDPDAYTMPDDIWFAWANGKANTRTDSRVQSSEWDDHARVHQYLTDITESYGGQSLRIDANWADVGRGSVAAPSKPMCTGVSVDLRHYPKLRLGKQGTAVSAAQCLLRRQGFSKTKPNGRFDKATVVAVRRAQAKLDLKTTGTMTRETWTALLARGSRPVLKVGSTGASVFRLQRALTSARGRPTPIDGAYSTRTAKAVRSYQRKADLPATGVVTPDLWQTLLGSR